METLKQDEEMLSDYDKNALLRKEKTKLKETYKHLIKQEQEQEVDPFVWETYATEAKIDEKKVQTMSNNEYGNWILRSKLSADLRMARQERLRDIAKKNVVLRRQEDEVVKAYEIDQRKGMTPSEEVKFFDEIDKEIEAL